MGDIFVTVALAKPTSTVLGSEFILSIPLTQGLQSSSSVFPPCCSPQHPTLSGRVDAGRTELAAGKDMGCVGGKHNRSTFLLSCSLKEVPCKLYSACAIIKTWTW